MSGERPTEKTLIEQHGVWRAHSGEGFDRVESTNGVGLLEPVDGGSIRGWTPFLHQVAGNFKHGIESVTCQALGPKGLQWLHPHIPVQRPGKALGDRNALALAGEVRPLGGA